jgi:hypothetical protein
MLAVEIILGGVGLLAVLFVGRVLWNLFGPL